MSMNECSQEECDAWKRRRHIAVDPLGRPRALNGKPELSFFLPERTHDQTALADVIARGFGGRETLVQFVEWPMFTRHEMRNFQAWRERHGCPSRLMDAPGFEFPEGLTGEPGRALLRFLLAYRWEAHVLPASGDTFLCVQPYAARLTVAREGDAQAWRAALAGIGLPLTSGRPSDAGNTE